MPTWSYRESPLVDGDKVVCTPGGPDATLVALDKTTGKTIWKSQVPAGAGAGGAGGGPAGPGGVEAVSAAPGRPTPRPSRSTSTGSAQYVQLTAKALVGVAASDGKFLWRYDKPANSIGINCTTPLYHDGHGVRRLGLRRGRRAGEAEQGRRRRRQGRGGLFTRKMQNHHGGMILVDGCLYGANGGNEGGYLVCLDFKTGKVLWDERDGEARCTKGSIALADGRLYYRTENGTVLLIEPSPKQYVERGRFEQPDRSKPPAWAHPVIANGKLYLRDQDVLFCYDVKAK